MALDVTIEKLNDIVAVAAVHGALSMGTNLKTVDSNLQTLVAGGIKRLVLDLSDCPYLDSSGLGLVVMLNGLLGASGGKLRLCGVNSRVAGLLSLTRTDTFLVCDVDRAESLSAIHSPGWG